MGLVTITMSWLPSKLPQHFCTTLQVCGLFSRYVNLPPRLLIVENTPSCMQMGGASGVAGMKRDVRETLYSFLGIRDAQGDWRCLAKTGVSVERVRCSGG